ncbi:helix-turn-helix domain-containing protein [Paenibacillus sp. YN15]|uniref:helix-turn-helix domain-containing protein n=1 Tax=Paenibacillus sp. YN15 TaxID=1742774 RepID=UPI000DCEB1AE|nr:helix-turn-helix domain-containing protein [Paenibacillus sp. YN15]RAV04529.1 hypothetical protein DQG13_04730 [Paenibacillus sp. YN15]
MRLLPSSHKFFYKHLASYMILLLLPLLVLGGLIYLHFIRSFQDEILAANLNKLDRARSIVDAQLQQLQNIGSQITLRQIDNHYRFLDRPLDALDIIKDLNNYAVTNSFFSEIFLYYRGDQYLYSSTSSISLEMMNQSIFKYPSWSHKDFVDALNSLQVPQVRPAEWVVSGSSRAEKTRVVTFMYPLTNFGVNPNRTLLLQVPEQSITELLLDVHDQYTGNSYVLDEHNQIVASLVADENLNPEEWLPLIQDSRFFTNSINLNRQPYLLSCVKSDQTNWKYVTLIPQAQVLQKVATVKLVLLFAVSLIFLLGAVVIGISLNINYRPIHELKKFTDSLWNGKGDHANELEAVRGTLHYFSHQNRELNERLMDHSAMAQEYFLYKLFKGAFRSSEQIREQGELAGVCLDQPAFLVAGYYFHSKESAVFEEADWQTALEQDLPEGIQLHARNELEQKKLLLLASFEPQQSARLYEMLEHVKARLGSWSHGLVTMGVSRSSGSAADIPQCYLEVLTAIDYRLITGIGQSIYFSDINMDLPVDLISSQQKEKLSLSIRQGHWDQVDHLLDEIVGNLKTGKASLFAARLICLDIIRTVDQALEEVKRTGGDFKAALPDVFSLKEFETIDEMAETIKAVSHEISALLDKQKQMKKQTLVDQMNAYIREHFTHPNFSVSMMAEHFEMSQAYLSQYYKDQTGLTISDYDTSLKIERAKRLLASTRLPLRDIALEVGYYNVTSFIRRFKQVVGITPGEYRKEATDE